MPLVALYSESWDINTNHDVAPSSQENWNINMDHDLINVPYQEGWNINLTPTPGSVYTEGWNVSTSGAPTTLFTEIWEQNSITTTEVYQEQWEA